MTSAPLRSADLLVAFRSDLIRIRREVSEGWRRFSDATLTARPAPRKWSAIDCIEHVGRANSIYLANIDNSIDRADGQRRPEAMFHPGAVGDLMGKVLAPGPVEWPGDGKPHVGIKMPTLGKFDPTKDDLAPDRTKTMELFTRQLDQMANLAERLERVDLHLRTNSLLGPLLRLQIGDVLRYLIAHTDRHLVQADRAIDRAESRPS